MRYLNMVIDSILRFAGSTHFFVGMLFLFSIHAVWLAISGVYPLPFDEYYHFGIITIYAEQWSPFIHTQPLDAGLYGDITRMPSYLYHYLLSFPYRLFASFIDNEMARIVLLRLLNVAMIVGSMVLFRRLLIENGASRKVAHLALTAFAFTPVVSLLAAQINYDNLMLLLMPMLLSMAVNVIRRRGNLFYHTVAIIGLSLTVIMVKNSVAPLVAIIAIYLLTTVLVRHQTSLVSVYKEAYRDVTRSVKFAAVILLALVSGVLFAERYGGNIVEYGHISVPCEKVQSEAVCEMNTVWARNQQNIERRPEVLPYGPIEFVQLWSDRMFRGYFAIFSHAPGKVTTTVEPFGPIELRELLLVPVVIGLTLAVIGLAAMLLRIREVWADPLLRFFAVISGLYVLVLFVFNVSTYLAAGKPEAIQARYTLPILIPVFVVMANSLSRLITRSDLKVLLVMPLALFVITGGIIGRLAWNDHAWLWPDQRVTYVNDRLQDMVEVSYVARWREKAD